MRATDSDGATATSRRTLEVKAGNDPPAVQLNWMSGRNFSAQAFDDGAITEYAWDLDGDDVFDDLVGPGASLAALEPDFYGSREIGVRVTDDEGEMGVDRFRVVLDDFTPDAPAVYAFPSQPRVGQSVSLSASGANFDIGRREWDLDGDGTFETEGTALGISKTFATAGEHTVRVRITDVKGRAAVGASRIVVGPAVGNLAPYTQINAFSRACRAARQRQRVVGRRRRHDRCARLGHGRRRAVRRRHDVLPLGHVPDRRRAHRRGAGHR